MDDDLVVEHLGCVGRQGARGVGQWRPRVGDRVVCLCSVGVTRDRLVGSRVKEGPNTSVGNELATERNQLEGVTGHGHVGQLRPLVVDGIVAKHLGTEVGTVGFGDPTRNVELVVEDRNAGKSHAFSAGHARPRGPVANVGVVLLHHAGGVHGRLRIGVQVTDGVDDPVEHPAAVVLLCAGHLFGGRGPPHGGHVEDIDGFGRCLVTGLDGVGIASTAHQVDLVG